MTLYRKKPVVIEAMQWDGSVTSYDEIEEWVTPGVYFDLQINGDVFKIAIGTLEGILTASPGDFIVRGVQGEHYACKPDVFELTYELAE